MDAPDHSSGHQQGGNKEDLQKLLDSPIVSSTPAHPLVGKDLVDHKNPPPSTGLRLPTPSALKPML
jgi:hypothetical protein